MEEWIIVINKYSELLEKKIDNLKWVEGSQ